MYNEIMFCLAIALPVAVPFSLLALADELLNRKERREYAAFRAARNEVVS